MTYPLQAVEHATITLLVDNMTDVLLPSTATIHRPSLEADSFVQPPLFAEHGFSCLVSVQTREGHTTSLLYDAGLGQDTVVHNVSVLGITPDTIEAIVLSHGHTDHHGGLLAVLQWLNKPNIPLVLHPDAWQERKGTFAGGGELHLPPPNRAALEAAGARIIEQRDPSLWLNDTVLVTGQVARTSNFETGVPTHMARAHDAAPDDEWHADTWIWDDQAIVLHVQHKGLVILSGCSHAGIVNVVRYAQHITGVQQVHAIIGGFHLSGKHYEQIIPSTIDVIQSIAPNTIMPGHCTGWKAIHDIAHRMPAAFVQPSVGTRVTL